MIYIRRNSFNDPKRNNIFRFGRSDNIDLDGDGSNENNFPYRAHKLLQPPQPKQMPSEKHPLLIAMEQLALENLPETRTAYPRSINLRSVTPLTPPYVSGLIVKIMDELESRTPPLSMLKMGEINPCSSLDAKLDTLVQRCVHDWEITNIHIKYEDSMTLLRILLMFLQRLDTFLFPCSNALFNVILKKKEDNDDIPLTPVIACERACEMLQPFQQSGFAYFMARFQIWIRRDISLVLKRDKMSSYDSYFNPVANIIAKLFSNNLIGLSRNFVLLHCDGVNLTLEKAKQQIMLTLLTEMRPEFWAGQGITAITQVLDLEQLEKMQHVIRRRQSTTSRIISKKTKYV